MKTDKQGCSTCPRGGEQFEPYTHKGRPRVQYEYRHTNGDLFSTTAINLLNARKQRDKWMKKNSYDLMKESPEVTAEQEVPHIKFHNCTAKVFRIDGTYTVQHEPRYALISGYYKGGEHFDGLRVKLNNGSDDGEDDNVFFYYKGVHELQAAVKEGENTGEDFVVESWDYEPCKADEAETHYDFTIIYNNYTQFQNGGADNTTLLWTDDNCPDDSSDIEHEIIAQFKQELPELLKQAELTQTEHSAKLTPLTPEQLELISAAWSNAYSEDIASEYSGFWEMIGGKPFTPAQPENTYEKWVEEFKPVRNKINRNAPYNGWMFETFGEEVSHVINYNVEHPYNVWTIVDADGHLYVIAGCHFVNRVGYLITEKEWTADDEQKEYFIS